MNESFAAKSITNVWKATPGGVAGSPGVSGVWSDGPTLVEAVEYHCIADAGQNVFYVTGGKAAAAVSSTLARYRACNKKWLWATVFRKERDKMRNGCALSFIVAHSVLDTGTPYMHSKTLMIAQYHSSRSTSGGFRAVREAGWSRPSWRVTRRRARHRSSSSWLWRKQLERQVF